MIIAAKISMLLSKLGYEITGMVAKGEDALIHINDNLPDIVLLDIQLKGRLDGIETGAIIKREYNIPLIYLTANADDAHFRLAKTTNPSAFISKPFKKIDLQHAIELTVDRLMEESQSQLQAPYSLVLGDRIFVRDHEKMVKIKIENIYYIEADRNYCRIYTKEREYLLVMTLKDMTEKLPEEHFIRIHRSYVVNIAHIDEVALNHIVIFKKALPVSKSLKDGLLSRLQTI